MKRSIQNEFVVISPDKRATVEPNDAALYERLDRQYNGFRGHGLVSCHEFDENWPTWEIHPRGDEVVLLLSGRVTLVLRLEEGDRFVDLEEEGSYVIVPRNVWHTARTNVATRMLFITPGEGTQNSLDPNGSA